MDEKKETYLKKFLFMYEEHLPKWEKSITDTAHQIESSKQLLSKYQDEADEIRSTIQDLKKILGEE